MLNTSNSNLIRQWKVNLIACQSTARGTETDTDSSVESLSDSVFDDMLGQYIAQHEERHSAESEEPNPESSRKKARKQELSLLTPEELVSPMALKKTHQKAPISPPPFSDAEIAGIDLLV